MLAAADSVVWTRTMKVQSVSGHKDETGVFDYSMDL